MSKIKSQVTLDFSTECPKVRVNSLLNFMGQLYAVACSDSFSSLAIILFITVITIFFIYSRGFQKMLKDLANSLKPNKNVLGNPKNRFDNATVNN